MPKDIRLAYSKPMPKVKPRSQRSRGVKAGERKAIKLEAGRMLSSTKIETRTPKEFPGAPGKMGVSIKLTTVSEASKGAKANIAKTMSGLTTGGKQGTQKHFKTATSSYKMINEAVKTETSKTMRESYIDRQNLKVKYEMSDPKHNKAKAVPTESKGKQVARKLAAPPSSPKKTAGQLHSSNPDIKKASPAKSGTSSQRSVHAKVLGQLRKPLKYKGTTYSKVPPQQQRTMRDTLRSQRSPRGFGGGPKLSPAQLRAMQYKLLT